MLFRDPGTVIRYGDQQPLPVDPFADGDRALLFFRGVGLSGVKEIVETQMHGTIRVESGADSGTTFTLDLPLEAQMKEA